MTLREYYLKQRAAEKPAFMKVLKALPKDQLSYKPHESSPSAEQIVWTLAASLKACLGLADKGNVEWENEPAPPLEGMIQMYEKWSDELSQAVSQMDDAAWNKKVQLLYQGKAVFDQPLGDFLWSVHFDAIHHRGQLSAYLRPMGGKVPAIYGPSADEQ